MSNATKKFAGTFEAVEMKWSVGTGRAEDAQASCKKHKLLPKPYAIDNGRAFFLVVVPLLEGDSSMDATCDAFAEEMKLFNYELWGRRRMNLICRPEPEIHPCEFGIKRGRCGSCHQIVPLNGPIIVSVTPFREVYMTCPHMLCCGGDTPEVGSIEG